MRHHQLVLILIIVMGGVPAARAQLLRTQALSRSEAPPLVLVIMGQSNADGRGIGGQSYSGSLGSRMYRGGAWSTLADPVGDSGSAAGSPYPLLANMIEASQGRRVDFIVGETQGSTKLLQHWSRSETNYEGTVSSVVASGVGSLDAVLLYLGENDAFDATALAVYRDSLSQMLDDFQADTGFDAPLLHALIGGQANPRDDEIDAIRAAVMDRWDNDVDIYPGPVAHAESFSDEVHWKTDAEMARLAAMWYRTLAAALAWSGAESGQGPRVEGMAIGSPLAADQIAVTFDVAVQNHTDPAGWTVSDGAGARSVLSAAQGATSNIVVLTIDQDLTGSVTVSWAKGESAEGATLGDTSPLVGMPPEPVLNYNAGTVQ